MQGVNWPVQAKIAVQIWEANFEGIVITSFLFGMNPAWISVTRPCADGLGVK